MSITDFLKTKRSKEELSTTLQVLKEFKANESELEWLETPFYAWIKLEQFEEFLDHLINNTDLKEDTTEYIKILEQ